MQSLINLTALKALVLFSSPDEFRYYLNGVFVTFTADGAEYVATDGHVLLAHNIPLGEGEDRAL